MNEENNVRVQHMMADEKKILSVVVPVYNESAVLSEFHKRLAAVLAGIDMKAEILYVNDGSTDSSLQIIRDLGRKDARVAWVDLSRNFGKEAALTAGLDHSIGDAVVIIDADLQDPPELIPEMINILQEGYDTVYAQRESRKGESFFKKATAAGFYRLMQSFGRTSIPKDTGDFRILSRRAVNALKLIREHHRFMKGLFTWIGYRQREVRYERDPRYAGETKFNYWKLWNFALEGITSYTTAPLKLATYIGFAVAGCAFLYALFIIIKTFLFFEPVRGYPSLIVVILFLGGLQLIFIGFIGEYLGRTYDESKRRPLYFLNEYAPSQALRAKNAKDAAVDQGAHNIPDDLRSSK